MNKYRKSHLAFAVVMTGETTKYGNIILKKELLHVNK
jgi:L-fucose mutarotase/ribose pyranase (RbsD/FucU family)